MKKFIIVVFSLLLVGAVNAQDLPKDVNKIYKNAEKLKNKKEYDRAIATYKEVLRSVEHVPSLISIGDIQSVLRAKHHYREAYEYYSRAIVALDQGIATSDSKSAKKYMTNLKAQVVPKCNKAKSYVDDFDKAKELKEGGNRLLEDPDLND